MNDKPMTLKTVNTNDVNLVSKTGLGCGVDITGVLGTNESVKTQILDYNLLVQKALVELDGKPFKYFEAHRDEWAVETSYV